MANVKGKDNYLIMPEVDGTPILPSGGSAGQVLSKIDGTDYNTEWSDPGTTSPLARYDWNADQLIQPTVGTGWDINNPAPVSNDVLNPAIRVARFDDTTQEAVGFYVNIPADATNMTIRTTARQQGQSGLITVATTPVETFFAAEATSRAINLPTFVAGDCMVVALNHSPDGTAAIGTVSIPTGWVQIGTSTTTGAASNSRLTIIRRIMQGGDPATVTVTSSTAMSVGAIAVAYKNVDATTPIDATTPAFTTGNSATVTHPSVTTATANTRIVRVAITDAGDLQDTQPAGHTQRGWMSNDPPSNGMSLGMADIAQAAIGASGTTTWPNVGAEEWVGATFALRNDPTGAAPGGNALPVLHKRAIPNNAAITSWSTNNLTTINCPASNTTFQYDVTTDTLANLGITPGQLYQMQLSRNAPAGGDTLTGDLNLVNLVVEFT